MTLGNNLSSAADNIIHTSENMSTGVEKDQITAGAAIAAKS